MLNAAEGEEQARAWIARLEQRTERFDVPFEHSRIHWRRIGNGRPLVLVHGGQGSWLHWVRNIDALAAGHELWLPDLPGCGESDELAAPTNLDRLVAALCHTIDRLIGAGRTIDVAAFSFGSVVASQVVAARGHVHRLALLGATGHGLARNDLPLQNWRLAAPGAAQTEAHLHNLSHQMLHDRAAIDPLALAVHRDAAERARLRSKPMSRSDATRRALDGLQLPTLLAWGEHDPTADVTSIAATLAEGHPNRRCLVIPHAGHWLIYERAAQVNALLGDWFG